MLGFSDLHHDAGLLVLRCLGCQTQSYIWLYGRQALKHLGCRPLYKAACLKEISRCALLRAVDIEAVNDYAGLDVWRKVSHYYHLNYLGHPQHLFVVNYLGHP